MWFIVALALPVFSLTSVSALANSTSVAHEGLLHYLETDRYSYVLIESVYVSYTVTNMTEDPVTVGLSQCGCPIVSRVRNPSSVVLWQHPSCVDEFCEDVLDPGESYVLDAIWDMTDGSTEEPIEDPGVYTVQGKLQVLGSLGYVVDLEIEILDPQSGTPDEPSKWGRIKALYR